MGTLSKVLYIFGRIVGLIFFLLFIGPLSPLGIGILIFYGTISLGWVVRKCFRKMKGFFYSFVKKLKLI